MIGLLLAVASLGGLVSSTPVLVQQVCRHGDRAPYAYYPNYPQEQRDMWPQGAGALTPLGMQQTYDNGVALRERYPDLLSDIFQSNQTKVVSSHIDRTIQTADATLAGLYPPVGAFNFAGLGWQAIPVHTISKNIDYYIHGDPDCPALDAAYEDLYVTPRYANFIGTNQNFIYAICALAGYPPEQWNVSNVGVVQNCFVCNEAHNLSIPDWATPEVRTRMWNVLASWQHLTYTYPGVTKYYTGGGPLLSLMVNNILDKISGDITQDYILYSGHDITLMPFAGNLGLPVGPVPAYASCYTMELNQNDSGYFVNMYFKNTTLGMDQIPMTIPACGLFDCPLSKFLNVTQSLITPFIAAACNNPEQKPF